MKYENMKYEPENVKYEPENVKYEPENMKYEPENVKYEPENQIKSNIYCTKITIYTILEIQGASRPSF